MPYCAAISLAANGRSGLALQLRLNADELIFGKELLDMTLDWEHRSRKILAELTVKIRKSGAAFSLISAAIGLHPARPTDLK